jgi:starvation-inducible outer membrane lipoprotein
MKHLILLTILISLSGCAALPSFFQTAEDIADDTAIKVEVSRETFQKETDLNIQVNVKNKDEPISKKDK